MTKRDFIETLNGAGWTYYAELGQVYGIAIITKCPIGRGDNEMKKATISEAIGSEACAHLVADGEVLRVHGGIESLDFTVEKYPSPGLPESQTLAKLAGHRPTAREITRVLRNLGYRRVTAHYDE